MLAAHLFLDRILNISYPIINDQGRINKCVGPVQ